MVPSPLGIGTAAIVQVSQERDKAVYAYPSEHLAGWAVDLDQPDLPNSPTAPCGENISTRGATEDEACIGDVWRWGTAVLQVAQPRWPCQKLDRLLTDRSNVEALALLEGALADEWRLPLVERLAG